MNVIVNKNIPVTSDLSAQSKHTNHDSITSLSVQSMESLAKTLSTDQNELEKVKKFNDKERESFVEQRLNTISSKMLISKSTLLNKFNNGGTEALTDYLSKKKGKYGSNGTYHEAMVHAREQYAKISKNQEAGGLSEQEVMKACRLSLRHLYDGSNTPKAGGVAFQFNNKHFLAAMKDHQLQLVNWSGKINTGATTPKHPSHLGSGTFGVAQKVYDVTNGEFAALKIAVAKKQDRQERAEKDVKNESSILEQIHGNGSVDGIQEKFRVVFDLTRTENSGDKRIVGVMGRIYKEGDLFKVLFEDNKQITDDQKKSMVMQLFSGLERIQQHVLHGDIKLENIFVRYDSENKKWHVYIADLGGALKKDDGFTLSNEELLNRNTGLGTMATPGYLTETDIDLSIPIVDEYDESTTTKNRKNELDQKWRELQQKRDVFATAMCAWAVLTKDFPYEMFESYGVTYPYTASGIDNDQKIEVAKIIGVHAMNTLIEALDEDPTKRPSPAKLRAALAFPNAFESLGIPSYSIPFGVNSVSEAIVKASKENKEFALIENRGEYKILYRTDYGYSIKDIDVSDKENHVSVDGNDVKIEDFINDLKSKKSEVKFEDLPVLSFVDSYKVYENLKSKILIRKSGDRKSLVVVHKKQVPNHLEYPPGKVKGTYIYHRKALSEEQILEIFKKKERRNISTKISSDKASLVVSYDREVNQQMKLSPTDDGKFIMNQAACTIQGIIEEFNKL